MIVVLCAASAIAATGAFSEARAAQAPTPSSLLREGRLGKVRWHVVAEHPAGRDGAGPLGARRPCLLLQVAEMFGRFLDLRSQELCYGSPGYLEARSEPLIVSEVLGRDSNGVIQTLFAVALPSAATTLHLKLGSAGSARKLHGALITPTQASMSGLRRFRLATFLLPETGCIRQMSMTNGTGSTLWESAEASCSARSASSTAAQVG